MILEILIVATVALAAGILMVPRLRRWSIWRAMVTPLASIIGSGFLILGPLLNYAFGVWAPLAMAALCLVAWGFGAAIRDNIAFLGDVGSGAQDHWSESAASAILGFAYMISVAYYLNLLGSFALSLTPFGTPFNARILTSAVYLLIGFIGWTRGFKMLESLEYSSVTLKLAIIAGLLVALAVYFTQNASNGALVQGAPRETGMAAITLGFGLIVTVQGFETSRYLGDDYDALTRIRSMRMAQILSAAVYIAYITLVAFSFTPSTDHLSETAIVHMMGFVSPILPFMLVAAALAAQFSAAVADTNGSGGLVFELSRKRIPQRLAYVLTVAVGLGVTWIADVFQIIAYASRAFAAYYSLQAAIAAVRVWPVHKARAVIYGALAVLGLAMVFFGRSFE
tara:strand:+ start:2240 stop:3427 length:1188 start_codon:yes stop_codon:yes gene_type:complete